MSDHDSYDAPAGSVVRSGDSEPPKLRWFLVFTKSCSESKAEVNLQRQGFRVYLPRLCREVRHKGDWVRRVAALFPRYLFIQLDEVRQSLASVRSTVGVVNVVRVGSAPALVPDAIVSGLMSRADSAGFHCLSNRGTLRPGCRVSIIAGVFEGLDGIFDRASGPERAVILLRLLGLETHVSVESRLIVPAVA